MGDMENAEMELEVGFDGAGEADLANSLANCFSYSGTEMIMTHQMSQMLSRQ